jgi:hypothetical protein
LPSLEDLLHPTPIDEFLARSWERAYFHATNPRGAFDDLFALRDVERWARSTRQGFFFVLHPLHSPHPENDSVRIVSHDAAAVDPSVLSRNHENGFAQILKMVRDWPALQGLVGHFEAVFQTTVYVNVLLTPARARTHPTYLCNDNIFVLQVEGEQTWELRELSVLQLDLEQKRSLEFSDDWKNRDTAPLLAEVHQRAGEVLYIPRGMPHFTHAPERGTGLQLRIYVKPFTWVDLFKMAAEHAAVHSEAMRRSLPVGFVEDDTLRDGTEADFRQLMEEFRNVSFDHVLSAVRRNRVAHQGFPPSDALGARVDPEELGLDSELERRPDVLSTVEEISDLEGCPKSALFFGKEQIVGPPGLRRAFEFVRARKRFRISDLPGLDAESQLVLARRLVREGLLRPADGSDESGEGDR